MSTFANSEDPDVMLQRFLLGISSGSCDCLLGQKSVLRKRNTIVFFEIITFDPSEYTMDHLNFIVHNFIS